MDEKKIVEMIEERFEKLHHLKDMIDNEIEGLRKIRFEILYKEL